jgi:ribose transport system substrate-binding protein
MTHLAVITKNHTNPAYAGALVGARLVATRFGTQIRHFAPETPDDVEQQSALVRQAIAGAPQAIILLPAHASGLNRAILEVNEAGIPLFLFVSEPTTGRWTSYVGSDSEAMAFELGMRLLPRLAPDAAVAIIDGHPGSITTPQRHRGFLAAIERFPGMRLLDAVSGQYQFAPGRQAALELLRRHARIDALMVSNDLMAMGALAALQETGRQTAVVSINGTPDAVAAVRRGELVATSSFDTFSFGCLVVEAAIRHGRGETVPRRIELPAAIIDEANAAEWDRPYEQRIPPEWANTIAACAARPAQGN